MLVFIWAVKAAAASGGVLVQLLIPGLGLSPMQHAEEMIARDNGLPIERRVLNRPEVGRLGMTVQDEALLDEKKAVSDAIGKCVKLVRHGNAEEKTKAAGELADRAVNDESAAAIREAGGIPPLVGLAKDGTADQKTKAAGALGNLAADAQNKVAIREAGGIPTLVGLAKDGTADQKTQAAGAQRILANDAQNKVAIREAGGNAVL